MLDDRLRDIFLDCIKIEGLSQRERNVADFIKSFLAKLGIPVDEDNSSLATGSNAGNLICRIGNGGNMFLASHMDTARSTANVNPRIQDDRITSDGSTVLGVDNRVGISILLYLLEKIRKENPWTIDFTVIFTTCEETTLLGSKSVQLNGQTEMGFVFDSYLRPGKYVNSSYGAAAFSININGKAAHAGIAPETGVSSIEIASKAICKLKLGRIDDFTTLNIAKINGGDSINVIPEHTSVEGEVRSADTEVILNSLNDIEKAFSDSASECGGSIEFEYSWEFKPFNIPPDSRIIKVLHRAMENAGVVPDPGISAGGSDANSFNEKGITSINLGIGAQNPHSNDEYILKTDLQKSFEIAYQLVKK